MQRVLISTEGTIEAKSTFGFKLSGDMTWYSVGSYRMKYLNPISKGARVKVTYFESKGRIKTKTFRNVTYITPL